MTDVTDIGEKREEAIEARVDTLLSAPAKSGTPVVVDGRLISQLHGLREGDEICLILDGRFSINVPKEISCEVAWLVSNALAIGAGYPFLGAEEKKQPFAPQCIGLDGVPE